MPDERPRVEQEQNLFAWRGPSRPFKRGEGQFLSVPMAISILVIIILALSGEWIMIGVVAALMFVYYVWSTVTPEEIEYVITTRGIRVGGQLYLWEAMTRWWMGEKWGHKMAMVEVMGLPGGRLGLPLGGAEEGKMELILNKYLLKERPPDSRMDKAAKWLEEKFPLTEKK